MDGTDQRGSHKEKIILVLYILEKYISYLSDSEIIFYAFAAKSFFSGTIINTQTHETAHTHSQISTRVKDPIMHYRLIGRPVYISLCTRLSLGRVGLVFSMPSLRCGACFLCCCVSGKRRLGCEDEVVELSFGDLLRRYP